MTLLFFLFPVVNAAVSGPPENTGEVDLDELRQDISLPFLREMHFSEFLPLQNQKLKRLGTLHRERIQHDLAAMAYLKKTLTAGECSDFLAAAERLARGVTDERSLPNRLTVNQLKAKGLLDNLLRQKKEEENISDEEVRRFAEKYGCGVTAIENVDFVMVILTAKTQTQRVHSVLVTNGLNMGTEAGFDMAAIGKQLPNAAVFSPVQFPPVMPRILREQIRRLPTGQSAVFHTANAVYLVQIRSRRNIEKEVEYSPEIWRPYFVRDHRKRLKDSLKTHLEKHRRQQNSVRSSAVK